MILAHTTWQWLVPAVIGVATFLAYAIYLGVRKILTRP